MYTVKPVYSGHATLHSRQIYGQTLTKTPPCSVANTLLGTEGLRYIATGLNVYIKSQANSYLTKLL